MPGPHNQFDQTPSKRPDSSSEILAGWMTLFLKNRCRVLLILAASLGWCCFAVTLPARADSSEQEPTPTLQEWLSLLSRESHGMQSAIFFSQPLDANLMEINWKQIHQMRKQAKSEWQQDAKFHFIPDTWQEIETVNAEALDKEKWIQRRQRKHRNQWIYQKVFQGVRRQNKKLLESLLQPSPQPSAVWDKSLFAPKISRVYKQVENHEVASVAKVGRYDNRGDIGFCFGRAMLTHHLLLHEGFEQRVLAKIFAIGKLRYGSIFWNFHMATMVRNGNGEPYVIDTLYPAPLRVSDWMQKTALLGAKRKKSQVLFYVTDPRKFQPAYGSYSMQQMQIPELSQYFEDLSKTLQNNKP